MSTGIMAYQYEAEKLHACFGSLDKRTRWLYERSLGPRLKQLDRSSGQKEVLYKAIMKDCFDGQINHPNKGAMYLYFLEALIDQTMMVAEHRSSCLNNSHWYPSPLIPFAEISELKLNDFPPFAAVEHPIDFPFMLHAHYRDLASLENKIELVSEDAPQQAQFLEWVQKAKSNQFDLYLFCY